MHSNVHTDYVCTFWIDIRLEFRCWEDYRSYQKFFSIPSTLAHSLGLEFRNTSMVGKLYELMGTFWSMYGSAWVPASISPPWDEWLDVVGDGEGAGTKLKFIPVEIGGSWYTISAMVCFSVVFGGETKLGEDVFKSSSMPDVLGVVEDTSDLVLFPGWSSTSVIKIGPGWRLFSSAKGRFFLDGSL